MGPWPHIGAGYEEDWSSVRVGDVDMPEVKECERTLEEELKRLEVEKNGGGNNNNGHGGFSLDNFK